ncbi:MAG TPA: hypothetical protein VLT16_10080 [Candidatus Limnocylindrales bacterium]|nr:hypothetical protein [Candidatus Limnocylindrales bacterium]
MSISAPEGFAYYAMHPLSYADVVRKVPDLAERVAVIGIRSIGTTLSAVTAAAIRKQGKSAARITVRPEGHPYNREMRFSDEQSAFVAKSLAVNADFLIVDEGPGLSGSSFLSVAEALVAAGVPREKVTLICGHAPDFGSLRSDDGPQRATRFRWLPVESNPRPPEAAAVFIGGGEWRRTAIPDESCWPACWTSFERLKYLSAAGAARPQLFKFLGLGHYGDAVFEREQRAADAGFGIATRQEINGFVSYPRLDARPMRAGDLSDRVLARLASYCAFRAQAFPFDLRSLGALQQMAEHNRQELKLDFPVQLRLERPVISDGRMQPHEWLLARDGQILKTDSGSHGDDHFFPGPTDIAWDLSGAIVEWGMNAAQAEAFLETYRHACGDDARLRIRDFIAAYAVFRSAWCLMAANALHGSPEQLRLEEMANRYRVQIVRHCAAAAV